MALYWYKHAEQENQSADEQSDTSRSVFETSFNQEQTVLPAPVAPQSTGHNESSRTNARLITESSDDEDTTSDTNLLLA
jgi:hypothetical protein